ncbi:hypothetical protein ILYODFUR_028779 [Ilyodon furcidens]|uniref:Uncharacterized protein n=1 Tax=Ilyodon furcidens TaxID=33524 RepID=A0ABV0TBW1_9TELE
MKGRTKLPSLCPCVNVGAAGLVQESETPPTEAIIRSNTILFCNTTVRRAVTSVGSPVRAFMVALTNSPSR